jgi:transcriptional regulator with XRE-family HTH domain
MGALLEKAIRKKGINITELAAAIKVSRRTIYNWFKQDVIDKDVMDRISGAIQYNFNVTNSVPVISQEAFESPLVKNELYWQDRYIDLLERYAKLLKVAAGSDV